MEKYNYKKARFIGNNTDLPIYGFDEGKEYFYRYLENNRGVEIWFEGKKGCSMVTGLEPFNACFEEVNKEYNRYLELKQKFKSNEYKEYLKLKKKQEKLKLKLNSQKI